MTGMLPTTVAAFKSKVDGQARSLIDKLYETKHVRAFATEQLQDQLQELIAVQDELKSQVDQFVIKVRIRDLFSRPF